MIINEIVRDVGKDDARGICVRAYLTALECEEEHQLALAREALSYALESGCKPEWLEPYAACYGLTGEELLASLSRRLSLYRLPLIFPVWAWFERLVYDVRWLRLSMSTRLRSHLRLHQHLALGRIEAQPNPAHSSPRNPAHAAVAISWRAVLTKAIEVRVGRPDGPLLSHAGPTGRTVTGEWVGDGTILFLQDVDGVPLTSKHTLGVVRVRVLPWQMMPSWFSPKRWSEEIEWFRLRAHVRARAHVRLERGGTVGFLRIPRERGRRAPRSMRRSELTLEWTSSGADAVEVRLDAPDGKLISRTGTSGAAAIGEWAHDGAVAYLQDVSSGAPLTRENTLDVIRVRI